MLFFFFFKQKTAYEMRISDWSSDVCSSDLPGLRDPAGGIIGGTNMITMHLSRMLGGDILFGLMSAVAFSTILAVVAGLTISISSATSHDLVLGLRKGRPMGEKAEIRLFRAAAIITSAAGILLAILFQKENITFLIVMGQTVAASTTFPLLFLARSEEHTSELQSLMRISYAVFCLKKNKIIHK